MEQRLEFLVFVIKMDIWCCTKVLGTDGIWENMICWSKNWNSVWHLPLISNWGCGGFQLPPLLVFEIFIA